MAGVFNGRCLPDSLSSAAIRRGLRVVIITRQWRSRPMNSEINLLSFPLCYEFIWKDLKKRIAIQSIFSRKIGNLTLDFQRICKSSFRTIDFSKRSVHLRKKKKKKKKKVFSKTIFTLESTRALKKGVRNPLREVSKSHCRSRRSIHLPKNRESDDSRNFYSQIYSHPEGITFGVCWRKSLEGTVQKNNCNFRRNVHSTEILSRASFAFQISSRNSSRKIVSDRFSQLVYFASTSTRMSKIPSGGGTLFEFHTLLFYNNFQSTISSFSVSLSLIIYPISSRARIKTVK